MHALMPKFGCLMSRIGSIGTTYCQLAELSSSEGQSPKSMYPCLDVLGRTLCAQVWGDLSSWVPLAGHKSEPPALRGGQIPELSSRLGQSPFCLCWCCWGTARSRQGWTPLPWFAATPLPEDCACGFHATTTILR